MIHGTDMIHSAGAPRPTDIQPPAEHRATNSQPRDSLTSTDSLTKLRLVRR
jgi:hypothetical protein